MNFETKFNIGDHAWYMKSNKPVEVVISAIEIFYVNTNQDFIKYNAKNVTNSVSWLDHTNLHENTLFKSKRELLESLFSFDTVCKGKNCNAINGIGHSTECVEEHDSVFAAMGMNEPKFPTV